MSLATNVQDLATRVATEAKALRTLINGNGPDLSTLTTTSKSSLVAAVNELVAAVAALGSAEGGATIADGAPATGSVWSSSKTNSEISAAVAALVGGAPGALDTLAELATALSGDAGFATTVTTALGNRVRTDTAAQGLNATLQGNARTNIGAAAATHGHALTDAGVTGVLPVLKGGTGGADAATARTNLGAASATHTHAAGDTNSGTFAAARLPAATETAAGAVELATNAETITGADLTRAVTPAALLNAVGPTGTSFVTTFEAGLV